jgi:hypothetical protein
MSGPFTSPVALSVPFQPNRNPDVNGGTSPIASSDTQNAIEEAYYDAIAYADTVSRFSACCAFDGNGSSGRWLAWMQNNPSDANPMVMPRSGVITELSFSTNGTSTTTITLFKNAVTTGQTIATVAQATKTATGLSVAFAAGDRIAFQVTAGSSSRPSIFMFARFT